MLAKHQEMRRALRAGWDALSWMIALPLAAALRYDFAPSPQVFRTSVLFGFGCALFYLVGGYAFRLYRGRYSVGSFDEVQGVVLLSITTALVGSLLTLMLPQKEFPRLTVVIGATFATAMMLAGRYVWRGSRLQSAISRTGNRTVIYGAGDAGFQILSLMVSEKSGEFQPVGFIDDDRSKSHLRRSGIRVLGTSEHLEKIIQDTRAETLLVAIAGISANALQILDRRCKPFGVQVRIIPTASEIAGGAVRLGDISDVTEEDLMGRRAIQTNERQITDFLRDRRVLITGAGGSIGSELARQIARYHPSQLFLLDRDETALHALQLSLDGSGTLTSEGLLLGDIRDRESVKHVFEEVRPEVVFHAAALKHLPLLERFPDEAWKTNVLGTRNVLAAAVASDVQVFVNISTDKAADPSSVLGYSKLITERLTSGFEGQTSAKMVSVRFGNVLGSRGSVLDTFRFQIAKGGPVTVTDELVTRYFMTVSEAVHLVLQAAVIGRQGETLILDMGTPVKISEVARYMIGRSGREIAITYTGLRKGEKISEVLISESEEVSKPFHPLISHAKVSGLGIDAVDLLYSESNSETRMRKICGLRLN
jgi:FlaA1/EpsC-like NDP-sugar epimerase